jgi:hypothetical protein
VKPVQINRVSAKLFARSNLGFVDAAYIPIFHAWIRDKRIRGRLLFDVADYKHVSDGPGVMLIAHEGHYALDQGGGRLGLKWSRKRDEPGPAEQRFAEGVRDVLIGARELEAEPTSPLRFSGAEIEIYVQSQLVAPNNDETFSALEPDLRELGKRLHAGADISVEHLPSDARYPFGVRIKTSKSDDLATLLARID